jgi:hypothetical protein
MKYLSTTKLSPTMNDRGYRISTEVFNTEHYLQYKQHFEAMNRHGLTIKGEPSRAEFYYAEIAYLLLETGIVAGNLDTGFEEILPGGMYARSYFEGFQEGVAHFNNKWAITPDTLYGPKSDHYFADLKAAYRGPDDTTPLEIMSNAMVPGWLEEAERIPLIINDASMRRNGYYAGLVFKYREMEKQHDRLRDQPEEEAPARQKEEKPMIDTLAVACISDLAFRAAKRELMDLGCCDETLTFKKRGKNTFKRLAGLIKGLEDQGYTHPLTDEEVHAIIHNTFGVSPDQCCLSMVQKSPSKQELIRKFFGKPQLLQ